MRFVIMNTEYPLFLEPFYAKRPALREAGFAEQMQARMETLFGVADSYSHSLRKLGHEAVDISLNNGRAQLAWAREHGVAATAPADESRRSLFPWTCQKDPGHWTRQVLTAQLRHYRPDVVLNLAMDGIDTGTVRELKGEMGFLVGQHAAAPLPEAQDWGVYDLAVSSFPPQVAWFRKQGLPAELVRLAFEPRARERIGPQQRDIAVSFVGSYFDVHSSRTAVLERLARATPLKIWGPAPKEGFGSSPLADCYQGQAWGTEMYRILARSRIVINHHGNIPPFANNLRLFEATGMGALLVTDWKENLIDMFEPGREAAAYRSAEECVELVSYYLSHEEQRAAMAAAGQKRTLTQHVWAQRAADMIGLVEKGRRAGGAAGR